MTAYQLLIWVHLILFVCWLGADLGVFIAAVWARNASLSFAERAILLKLATVIDQEAIRRPINTSLVVVSVLYLLLLTTSFLGLVKPDIAS